MPAEQERRARDRGLEFALNSANAGFRRFVVRVLREDPLIGGERLADLAALDREARVSEIETRIPGILEDLFEDPSQLGIILSVCGLRQYCGGNENAKPANEDWFPTAPCFTHAIPRRPQYVGQALLFSLCLGFPLTDEMRVSANPNISRLEGRVTEISR